MSDQDDIIEAPQDAAEESGPDNFFIDILTGNKESALPKKLLVQKVLRQLIESRAKSMISDDEKGSLLTQRGEPFFYRPGRDGDGGKSSMADLILKKHS